MQERVLQGVLVLEREPPPEQLLQLAFEAAVPQAPPPTPQVRPASIKEAIIAWLEQQL